MIALAVLAFLWCAVLGFVAVALMEQRADYRSQKLVQLEIELLQKRLEDEYPVKQQQQDEEPERRLAA